MDQINGQINAKHDDSIELTEFVGHFSPFNLDELESKVCKITVQWDGVDDSRLDDERRQASQDASAPQKPSQTKELCSFNELKYLVHDGKIFSTDQCTNLCFSHVEVICDLVKSFQAFSNLIRNQPELAGEYTSKQTEQASYYKGILRNIDVVLQMDQVHCVSEGLPQLPSPRYVPSRSELGSKNIEVILQLACSNTERTNKETQIIQMGQTQEKGHKLNSSDAIPDYKA